ncbi:Hint domain-containing protein [Anaerosacchariphilus polymeriproducens]|uniref:Hint domain-containing protein n=1 Tax=Anaerosacchariphilus polymeriproducens TaxID=1812858 RepID=A0A371ARH4_9FIRM|nr:Hint domain-containing protein [Anaerosacchariphilus polymeriproducens]RDU22166.1 hypothetical protein DWV06_16685 [Anaerosacchariphilus polymeriproducens]
MIQDSILKKRQELLGEIRKPGEVINLDFSNEVHNQYFLSLYGGYENLKENFPCFFKAYEDTKSLHEQGLGLNYKTLFQEEERRRNFVDGIDISQVSYSFDDKMLKVEGITSLVEDAAFIDEHLDIKTTAGQPVAGKSQSTSNSFKTIITIETDFNPSEFHSTEIQVDYTVVWMEKPKEEEKPLLKAQVYSKDSEVMELINFVDKVELMFPKSEIGNNPIIICYNREALVGESVDRSYPEAIYNGIQRLLLDFHGKVKFLPNTAKFQKIDPTTFLLKLVSRGMAQYSTAGRINEIVSRFTPSTDGFDFSLNYDWKDDVPTARLPLQDIAQIQMTVGFYLVDGKKGDIIISSTVPASIGNICKAIPLKLLWGCLSKDTIVTMADGSNKQINRIRIGEKLTTGVGSVGVVTNIWRGIEEEPLLRIETENGGFIKCTELHPLMTQKGIKTAGNLNGEDMLIDFMGVPNKITAIYPVNEKEVINLDLSIVNNENEEQGTTMICNGFIVGDNRMQNHHFLWQKEKMIEGRCYEEESVRKNQMFYEWGLKGE